MISEIKIDHSKRIPSSTQIFRILRSKIHENEIEIGEQLPPVREIAKTARVSTNTVRAAISVLESEGLVESTRGRGTFVTRNTIGQTADISANLPSQGVTKIGLTAIFNDTTMIGPDYALKIDSMGGVVKECVHINAKLEILPENICHLDSDELFQQLCSSQIQGLVWVTPNGDDWDSIEYLQSKNYPIVVTRRGYFERDDIVSVESDHEGAGFASANHFIDQGVKKVLFFTHVKSEFLRTYRSQLKNNIPYGLEYGLTRALEAYSDGAIDLEVCRLNEGMDSARMSELIIENIEKNGNNCGVMFSGAPLFINLMRYSGDRANERLSGRPLVVVSNTDMNAKMVQYVRDIDFKILSEPFEDIGRLAVQKLCNLISVNFASSSTLVKVNLENFWEKGISGN